MNVAVIGFGGWGRIHAQALSHLPDHSLKAIACHSEKTGAAAREEYPGVAVFTDYRDVLAIPEIDAVHVVVPSYLHVEIAIAALAAGKHVVLEKPMATTLAEADRLVDAVEKSDRVVTVVHELRVSEQWATVRRLIEEGQIGTPRYALLNLFRFPYRAGADNWRYSPDRVGSWVLEEPIHFVDLLLWYFHELGSPTEVTAFVNRDSTELSRDFTAIFRFSGGAHGVISQTLSAFEHHQVVEVTGSNGAIRSLWSGAMDRTDKPEFSVTSGPTGMERPEQVSFAAASGELFEIGLYLDRALKGFQRGESLYTVTKERELIRLCLAAEESARAGQTVDLKTFGRR
jgi:myo-inositol 2-dehydrogenase / D-chiro-inositol 1-dehydrogenase